MIHKCMDQRVMPAIDYGYYKKWLKCVPFVAGNLLPQTYVILIFFCPKYN